MTGKSVPLSAVRAALEKALPCEAEAIVGIIRIRLKNCEGLEGDDSPLCPNCRKRKAVMDGLEVKGIPLGLERWDE